MNDVRHNKTTAPASAAHTTHGHIRQTLFLAARLASRRLPLLKPIPEETTFLLEAPTAAMFEAEASDNVALR
jgi:hypothetical protein